MSFFIYLIYILPPPKNYSILFFFIKIIMSKYEPLIQNQGEQRRKFIINKSEAEP